MARLEEYRELFPTTERYIYLNHAGVAPTSVRVRDAIGAWVADLAAHGLEHEEQWVAGANAARESAARLIGARPHEIAFVRNTSHGLSAIAEGLSWNAGDAVAVCTSLEYPSNLYPWQHIGVGVTLNDVRADGPRVTAAAVRDALTPNTRLVAVSSVQYASGGRTELDGIGALCRDAGVLLCVDGIQSVGAFPTDVKKSGIHFLSADSHKWMLGVSGIGFLFIDESVVDQIRPSTVGWHSTTRAFDFDTPHFELRTEAGKLEEGSPSYSLIHGLGAALALLEEVGVDAISARITELVDRLDGALTALGCDVSPGPDARAGILTFLPPSGDPVHLVSALRDARVRVSFRRGRIRVSPHFYTSNDDIDTLVSVTRQFL